MQIYKSLSNFKSTIPRVISLGIFDGLHLGHRKILSQMTDYAKKAGLRPSVFTFESPYGLEAKRCLMDNEDKYAILSSLGIEDVFVAQMSEEFRQISAREFLNDILCDKINVKAIFLGEDARFGANAEGDIAFLSSHAKECAMEYRVVSDVLFKNRKISSSRIRNSLKKGNVEDVTDMLTRPYRLRGIVEHGREIASRKGFPTANFNYPINRAQLANGVYASVCYSSQGRYNAISNIGISPTISEETPLRVETYLYDFSGDLYGQEISVEFLSFMRPELKFADLTELTDVVTKDLDDVKRWHQSHVIK